MEEDKYNPFARAAKKNEAEKLTTHDLTHVKKTIAVISGKGGVGKSIITSLLAVQLMKSRLKVGIIDADITGPSIAKAFGQDGYEATGNDSSILPAETDRGLLLIGANNLLDNPETPIVWRGSLISNLVKTLYTKTIFDELDVLLIDMPPGTGDVPLTVFQSLPLDGVVVASTPQSLVSTVVEKSINMAEMMHVKILGMVMNMAYIVCPDCNAKVRVFGSKPSEELAKEMGIPLLDELPLDESLSKLVDEGRLEDYAGDYLLNAVKAIKNL